LRVDRWQEPLVRQAYVQAFVNGLNALLAQFSWVEIDLIPQIRTTALQLVAQYNLGGQDAVHLASATWAGVLDVASFDEGFRRVDGLSLWNDRIYTPLL
jgi:predicted nucleic acid-binding protein